MPTEPRDTRAASGDESLGGELRRALQRPLLSAEQERRLARRAAQGDRKARDRLVEGNVRLVVAVARLHGGRGVPHADLVQEGMIGLLRAIEGFDPRRGFRLSTYAIWWIRRSMLHAIVAAPAIRVPTEGRRELAAILRTEQALTTQGRPRPTSDTLSIQTGVPRRRVERLRSAARVVTSLDEQAMAGGTPWGDRVPDPGAPELSSALERADAHRGVVASLALLEPRVRRILQLRFGLAGGDPLTYDQIGQRLGLSAERTRQMAADALRRLRAPAERAALAA
jgi:RNA polymerase primary sigma factor